MVHDKFKRTATIQDVTWFLDLDESKRLDLNPSYQRRSVWTRKDRIFFLDTIFKGYPCPAIYLHKTLDERGRATYHVIDGKQRLETILTFTDNRLTLPKDFDNSNPNLAGKKWKDIEADDKKIFWNYSIPVDQFDAVEESIIDEMFERLNKNTKKLEAQELRHAKFDGWFITFAENLSENSEHLKNLKVITTGRSKRMKDVQFISELMLILILGKVNGFSQIMIDDYYAEYDNPEEELDFNTTAFEEKINKTIEYIYKLNQINNCVINHASTVGQFYTLFAVMTLAEKEEYTQDELKSIAETYDLFMKTYEEHKAKKDSNNKDIIDYTVASTGANTEEPLRTTRYDILRKIIFSQ